MTEQTNLNELKGLIEEEVKKLQQKYGKNQLVPEKKSSFLLKVLEVLKEPTFNYCSNYILLTWRAKRWHNNVNICNRGYKH